MAFYDLGNLRKRYSLREIEDLCMMPRRTLQPSRSIPEKYIDSLRRLEDEVGVVNVIRHEVHDIYDEYEVRGGHIGRLTGGVFHRVDFPDGTKLYKKV